MFGINNDNVQVYTLYVTIFIALIGFGFNCFSIWQTKKATEDMAKPFINIFVDSYAITQSTMMYVFKNFGSTPAYIDRIEVDGELDEFNRINKFQSLVGSMIAPNQKFVSTITKGFYGITTVTISYHDIHGKKYKDSFRLDPGMLLSLGYTSHEEDKSDEIPSAIRQSTMAILRDMK